MFNFVVICALFTNPSKPLHVTQPPVCVFKIQKEIFVVHNKNLLPPSEKWFHDYPFAIPLDSKKDGISIFNQEVDGEKEFYLFAIGEDFANKAHNFFNEEDEVKFQSKIWKILDCKFIDSLDERPVFWLQLKEKSLVIDSPTTNH